MFRSLAALILVAAVTAPAAAASYFAKPATPTSGQMIVPDMSWSCGSEGCQGSTMESRPVVLCESLAKRAGTIERFAVDGRDFSATELATCNAAVRGKNRAFAAK